MALYVPPQTQLPSIHMNTFANQNTQSAFTAPTAEHHHQHKGGCCGADEPSKPQGPPEECLTIDLSNTNAITLSIWNGSNTSIIKSLGLDDDHGLVGFTGKLFDVFTSIKNANVTDENSSKSIQLVSDFLKSAYSSAQPAKTTTTDKKSKPSTKSKSKVSKNITFVTNNSMQIYERQVLVEASKRAGISVKNIFTQDIAHVAYAYHSIPDNTSLFKAKSDHLVLVVSTTNQLNQTTNTSTIQTDISLVKCEVSSLNIDRLYTITTHHLSTPISTINDVQLSNLLQQINHNIDDIKGIIYTSPKSHISTYHNLFAELLPNITADHIIVANTDNVSMGGCLLSAAELDTSKDYIQKEDGAWKIMYQLPVADAFVQSHDIGILTINDSKETIDLSKIEVCFQGKTKVSKLDHGLLRPMSGKSLEFKKEYVRTSSQSNPDYPRVTIYTRDSADSNSTWVPVEHLYPLSTNLSGDKSTNTTPTATTTTTTTTRQCVYKSTMTLIYDPHTNTILHEYKQGQSTTQIHQKRSFWLQILGAILILICIPVGWYGYMVYQEYSVTSSHEQWLTQFYQLHAPEKLKDKTLVKKTIKKYNGKMFLLWRNLEKTYKIKLNPPPYVVEKEL